MKGQYAQAANKNMMKIGSNVHYVRSGGMRNVPVTKAVEHLYATTAKFPGWQQKSFPLGPYDQRSNSDSKHKLPTISQSEKIIWGQGGQVFPAAPN
ncbi:hypothetical protein AVEN_42870-1 [Araneus ventricosus]|uniref:Uncharacterized protein n=1 Tax=Araneus ventricosus TaxID=182803 RepID=A0A4Y2AET6_ARAVE|nr:hypothetical protein AVEN_42870-1 [Araneus ventricosus]